MNHRRKWNPNRASYAIGYGKPPAQHRFVKGQSGNPKGRPRGMTTGRANRILLEEIYRKVTIKMGDKVEKIPILAAAVRSQLAQAGKGNSSILLGLLKMIQNIEIADATAPMTHEDWLALLE